MKVVIATAVLIGGGILAVYLNGGSADFRPSDSGTAGSSEIQQTSCGKRFIKRKRFQPHTMGDPGDVNANPFAE